MVLTRPAISHAPPTSAPYRDRICRDDAAISGVGWNIGVGFACQHKAGFGITAIELQARQARKIIASDVVPEIFALKEKWPVSIGSFVTVNLCRRHTCY